MTGIGHVAIICVCVLTFAYLADLEPLYVALGVIALLCYMAFAGGKGYKKKPIEQQRPWYMD